MNDDYLWDRSGPPDPEIARLERLLRPLGHHATVAPKAIAANGARRASRRLPAQLLAAAAVVLAVAAALFVALRPEPEGVAWTVGRIEGSPVVGMRTIGDHARLPVGAVLETDAVSRARIEVADIGLVDVDPLTRVELVHSSDKQHRLRLLRGTLHASIVAPPGEFVVETPSSTAVDLGCAYTLRVDERGVGEVHVTAGWVGFEWGGRESFIPAGAMCQTRPGIGPGTPYFADAPPRLREALETLDFDTADPARRRSALRVVLEDARAEDGVTLWHLLTRLADAEERGLVHDRLATLVPVPVGVTREGIVIGNRAMVDLWWRELSFGDITFWRQWTQRWREQRPAR